MNPYRHLHCIRNADVTGAIANLHRHFDLHAVAMLHATTDVESPINRRALHTTALSLAAMHHHFGHEGEALLAVHVAIRIAQENFDGECLQHALGKHIYTLLCFTPVHTYR